MLNTEPIKFIKSIRCINLKDNTTEDMNLKLETEIRVNRNKYSSESLKGNIKMMLFTKDLKNNQSSNKVFFLHEQQNSFVKRRQKC